MKYANFILSLIAALLFAIVFHLASIKTVLEASNQNNQSVISANQALMSSNQRLVDALMTLKKQIDSLTEKKPKI